MTGQSDRKKSWKQFPGFVYFIEAGDAIKIGISKESKLLDRFDSIQSSNHEPLRLRGVIYFPDSECGMEDAWNHEKKLHKDFEKFQCKGAGSEWFKAEPEIKNYIEKNAMVSLKLAVPKSDKIWDKFKENVSKSDREFVKRFHKDLVSSGYISVSKGTLQFRLADKPEEVVMAIRIGTGSDMEIYLDHSVNTIKKRIIDHVSIDSIQTKLTKHEGKFPRFKLNEWKDHSQEFLTAFQQIAKEYNQE